MDASGVPYLSQWESPEPVPQFIDGSMRPADDPRWTVSGARTPREYEYWSGEACGLACLKMIMGWHGLPVPATTRLVEQALAWKAYVPERDRVAGLIYRPFAERADPAGARRASRPGDRGCWRPAEIAQSVGDAWREPAGRTSRGSAAEPQRRWPLAVAGGLLRAGRVRRAAGRFGWVSFNVSADAYLRFMGRFSEQLAVPFADLAGVRPGQRVLDVGCGPGALTAELVSRSGAGAVSAVEPSESFAAAARARLPGADVRLSPAEQLPFPDAAFDAALAQLVVHFMADPVAGLREMGRVTRPGGVVAACVWDHGGGRGPLTAFWQAARELDPAAHDESWLAGVREGDLARLFVQAGLGRAQVTTLTVGVRHASFEQWWEPFTLGVGPAGAYLASLDPERRRALRERCRYLLPSDPVDIRATAWAAASRT